MKKILVTGGAGYIGSHTIVELLNSGYTPVIIDNFSNSYPDVINRIETITNKKVTYHIADCTDYARLKEVFQIEKTIEGVIHFAACKAVGESVKNPLKYYHNNVSGLVTLLKVMQEAGINQLVFSSSCTVYGQPEKLPVNECSPRSKVESPYGNTKKMCEEIIEDTVASSDLKTITLRYFNPIGAHPSGLIGELPIGVPSNLVPFITQTAAGWRESLTVFGNDYNTTDGTCIRDYIHVVDLAKAHVKAIEYLTRQSNNGFNEIFNVGTGNGNTVMELVNTFEEVTGQKLNYKIGQRRPGDVEKIWSEVNKSNDILGWKAELSLGEALKHAWNWQTKLKQEKVQL
jgi:UDP-glucose 4-epimerase